MPARAEAKEIPFSPEVHKSRPEITVVVRARNEAENILDTLTSLKDQEGVGYGDYQVIVIDNGSTDGTREIVQKFLESQPEFPGRLITEEEVGRGKALQAGFEAATTELVACLDGDSIASPNWLRAVISYMKAHPDVVAGSGRIRFKNGPCHHKVIYDAARSITYATASQLEQGWISGANCWMKRSAFFAAGGTYDFPPEVIDDRILALRLRPVGKIAFIPEAEVLTENWLIESPTWLTNLADEMDRIKEVAQASHESWLHGRVRRLSQLCARWDGIKSKLPK